MWARIPSKTWSTLIVKKKKKRERERESEMQYLGAISKMTE